MSLQKAYLIMTHKRDEMHLHPRTPIFHTEEEAEQYILENLVPALDLMGTVTYSIQCVYTTKSLDFHS
jgi:hypothetical protein